MPFQLLVPGAEHCSATDPPGIGVDDLQGQGWGAQQDAEDGFAVLQGDAGRQGEDGAGRGCRQDAVSLPCRPRPRRGVPAGWPQLPQRCSVPPSAGDRHLCKFQTFYRKALSNLDWFAAFQAACGP